MNEPRYLNPHRCEHPGCDVPNCTLGVLEKVVDGYDRTKVIRHYCRDHYPVAWARERQEAQR